MPGPAEIAAAVNLSYGTVRNYLAAAVTKLGARNRVDAVRIAAEAGGCSGGRRHVPDVQTARRSGALRTAVSCRAQVTRYWPGAETGRRLGGPQIPVSPARHAQQAGPGDGESPVIRVLIAEDARVVRDTLVALLGLETDIEVTAAVAAGDQIVPAALEHQPDVALLDIGLPGVDGLTAAAELASLLSSCRVLILTGLDAPANLGTALRAGVRGFLLKDEACRRTHRRGTCGGAR